MFTLGINAAFHDPSAALIQDGKILAAAEEERFTRIKHGKRPVPFSTWELPFHSIHSCLKEAGIHLKEVDHIAYSFDPLPLLGKHAGAPRISLPLEPSAYPMSEEWEAAWDPLFLSSITNAPRHLQGGFPHHLQDRFQGLGFPLPSRWHFVPHHVAHAASAFHASPFEEAAILTLDGRGERATTTYGMGRGTSMEWLGQVDFPHSLGLLYEELTAYLGFLRSSDEYKVMALASFGKPHYLREFLDIIQVGSDGSYRIQELRLEERFGPARKKDAPLEHRHFDIASSLQQALEETVLDLCQWLHSRTQAKNLCMAGGVALNCVLNATIRDQSPFKEIWVQPAAGDAGTSLGAALWIDAHERRVRRREKALEHVFLGPSFQDAEIEELLRSSGVSYRASSDIAQETAALLAKNRVIGWFQGRMEFGPRALGARSILASPQDPGMQAKLNEIKDREDFRPVAPVVLEEEASRWFYGATRSPFMLFVYDVLPEKAERIPAVRHVDGTARVQTIHRDQHPRFYDLIQAFHRRTEIPVLVNTSFNTRGRPIVCTPRDALEAFWTSPLDALAIGSFLIEKRGW